MARTKGVASFSAAFESQSAMPIDARMVVDDLVDLTTAAVWEANDGGTYAYLGMIVNVSNDVDPNNNGVYELVGLPATVGANWRKLASLTQPQTFDGAQRGTVTALTDDATIDIDLELNNFFTVTLEGNRTLGQPTNVVPGQAGSIEVKQDAVGGRTLDFHADWEFVGGVAPVLSTAVNAVDFLAYFIAEDGTPIISMPADMSLYARVDQAQTFSGGQRGGITTLTDAATIDIDLEDNNHFVVTLEDNRTLGSPSTPTAGQSGIIEVRQDSVGSRTLAFHADWHFAGGEAPVMSTDANATDLLAYYIDSTDTPVIGMSEQNYGSA